MTFEKPPKAAIYRFRYAPATGDGGRGPYAHVEWDPETEVEEWAVGDLAVANRLKELAKAGNVIVRLVSELEPPDTCPTCGTKTARTVDGAYVVVRDSFGDEHVHPEAADLSLST